jgi:hypothetical protein
VLCKHEVVGSIPSGSTTLRLQGYAWRSQAHDAKRARRSSEGAKTGSPSTRNHIVRENIVPQSFALTRAIDLRDF